MLMKLTPVVSFINILQAAFALIFCAKKLQSQTVTREKLFKKLSYEKAAPKMLMKLTLVFTDTKPGFIIVYGNISC